MIHLGGTTLPGGLLVTMDARQGADLVRAVRPHRLLPVHYEEYGVMRSPLSDFLAEASSRGFAADVVHCERGRSVLVGPGAEEVTLLPRHVRR